MSSPRMLDGVRVLDLSRLFPGPYATLLLADLGADVVKVESPNGGDYIRYYPPHVDDAGGAAFWALNRGKRSIALDFQQSEDHAAFLKLVANVDVVVESFRPGVMEKLGLGPDVLLQQNPRLIVCRISGYGQEGPDRLRAGHDINYAARAGVLDVMHPKAPLPVQIADLAGGAWPAAMQICAALYGRERTDRGAVIDVSMTDGAHAMLIMPLARHAVDADERIDDGHDLLAGAVPSYGVYPTKEGSLAVGALEPKFWSGFCAAIGADALATDGLATGARGAEVRTAVEAILMTRTAAEWHALLAAADVCVEQVQPITRAHLDDDHLRGRKLRVDVVADDKVLRLPATPLSLAGNSPATSPAPRLGADSEDVLRDWATPRQ